MKKSIFKAVFSVFMVGTFFTTGMAQDDDAIYGDIWQTPKIEEVVEDSVSPLDGYSTVDDYYQDGRANAQQNASQSGSSTYTDPSGNNITNNYYGDYYEDNNDYDYAARINRFHRPIYGSGYYDPFYTNMYYYNYDPFYWGTSIYIGYRPSYWFGWNSWGWNSGWGWNNGWGWNSPYFYSPACYGGYGYGYGFGGGGYWNGYNNGYWNGYHDGLAYGGYYNTYDQNSGIYYGPRGASGTTGSSGTIGSGYRNTNFATVYNEAARSGKVNHANVGNVLNTTDARPVKADPSRVATQTISANPGASRQTSATSKDGSTSQRIVTENNRVRVDAGAGRTGTRENPYQGADSRQGSSSTGRSVQPNVDRTRIYDPVKPQDQRTSAQRSNTYQRGTEPVRIYNGQQPSRSGDTQDRGNMYRDLQRTQPSNNDYYRGNSNQNGYQQPSRSGNNSRNGNQNNYTSPSRTQPAVPSRTEPSRGSQPSRIEPSRGTSQPPRNVSPSPSPNRGSSNSGGFSTPSRSSGSMPSSGSRGGSSGSRGGRP